MSAVIPAPCRPMVRISTATLPGLIQTYAMAEDILFGFLCESDLLKAALDDATTKDQTVFLLQQGALALNCLECLDGGELDLLQSYLSTLAGNAYRRAEGLGRAHHG